MGKAESKVETHLHSRVTEELGGTTRKFTSPSHSGVADRLCFLPGGILYLIEVKTSDGVESGPQERERVRMQALGFECRVAYGKTGVDHIITEMKGKLR